MSFFFLFLLQLGEKHSGTAFVYMGSPERERERKGWVASSAGSDSCSCCRPPPLIVYIRGFMFRLHVARKIDCLFYPERWLLSSMDIYTLHTRTCIHIYIYYISRTSLDSLNHLEHVSQKGRMRSGSFSDYTSCIIGGSRMLPPPYLSLQHARTQRRAFRADYQIEPLSFFLPHLKSKSAGELLVHLALKYKQTYWMQKPPLPIVRIPSQVSGPQVVGSKI